MAAPGNKYFIQDKLSHTAPHHASFEALWQTKWKAPVSKHCYIPPLLFTVSSTQSKPICLLPHPRQKERVSDTGVLNHTSQCKAGVYPFMYGALKDFDPVVKKIIAAGLGPPYHWDEYAYYFMCAGEGLVISAREAEKGGREEEATELYMYVRAAIT